MPEECPPADGSAPKTQHFDGQPPMCIDPAKRYTALMETSKGTITFALDADRRAEDRQQLRLPRPLPLLRRHRVPPDHPGIRHPRRRPDRERHGRARLPLRRRAAEGRPLRDRLAGDGERRTEHQRQPVLHHLRAIRCPAPTALRALRQGGDRPRGHPCARKGRDVIG